MTNQTLDTRIVSEWKEVTDWHEVIPVVRPFHESFFGEEMPCLEGVMMSPEEISKKVFSGDLPPNILCNVLDPFCEGFYRHDVGVVGINFLDLETTSEISVHELTHMNRHKQSEVVCYSTGWLCYIPILRKYQERKEARARFLEECIAFTAQYAFVLASAKAPELREQISNEKASATNILDLFEFQLKQALKIKSKKCQTIGEPFDWKRKAIFDCVYTSAQKVAMKLVDKYQDDPTLWLKLKRLKSIDDLRRLVNE